MQQYDDSKGIRRELDIVKMEVEEVKEYYLQYLELSEKEKNDRENELKRRIIRSKKDGFYEWILAIKSKDGKVIGKIEVMEMGPARAFFTINLPNKNWKIRYGLEAMKQFMKICKENNYFSVIELDKNNSTVQRYIKAYGKKYKIDKNLLELIKVA